MVLSFFGRCQKKTRSKKVLDRPLFFVMTEEREKEREKALHTYDKYIKNQILSIAYEQWEGSIWVMKFKRSIAFWAVANCMRRGRIPAVFGRDKIRNIHWVKKNAYDQALKAMVISYSSVQRAKKSVEPLAALLFKEFVDMGWAQPFENYCTNTLTPALAKTFKYNEHEQKAFNDILNSYIAIP